MDTPGVIDTTPSAATNTTIQGAVLYRAPWHDPATCMCMYHFALREWDATLAELAARSA